MNKFSFDMAKVFWHYQPIMDIEMEAQVIHGMHGAFREAVSNLGHNPVEPAVGARV